jgi:hypothetical protein
MYSYKTTIALKIIVLLTETVNGLTINELRIKIGNEHTIAINKTVQMLSKSYWITINRGARYRLSANLNQKSLYDLIIVTDHKLQLDSHVEIDCSDITGISDFRQIGKNMNNKLTEMLREVELGKLIYK